MFKNSGQSGEEPGSEKQPSETTGGQAMSLPSSNSGRRCVACSTARRPEKIRKAARRPENGSLQGSALDLLPPEEQEEMRGWLNCKETQASFLKSCQEDEERLLKGQQGCLGPRPVAFGALQAKAKIDSSDNLEDGWTLVPIMSEATTAPDSETLPSDMEDAFSAPAASAELGGETASIRTTTTLRVRKEIAVRAPLLHIVRKARKKPMLDFFGCKKTAEWMNRIQARCTASNDGPDGNGDVIVRVFSLLNITRALDYGPPRHKNARELLISGDARNCVLNIEFECYVLVQI
ncbi:MAG: hypothetical protein SGARI_000726 [Bacillariaceae sp.]